jgi:hypothetical protein
MDEFSETQRVEDDEDGSEGGRSPGAPDNENKDTLPLAPSEDDDTPLGDTDQHSDADA